MTTSKKYQAKVKKTDNGNYVAVLDGVLKYSGLDSVFKEASFGSFDGIPVKSELVFYDTENEIVSNYEKLVLDKNLEYQSHVESYNNSEEVKRLDFDGQKIQLRSNGRLYRYSFGWVRRPLNETAKTAILARHFNNEPLDLKSSSFDSEYLKVLVEKQQKYISEAKYHAERIRKEMELFNNALNGEPLEPTLENISLVLSILNKQNWGVWRLPKFKGVGYSAHQYDCDGKTASTLTFDKKVSEWNVSKFVTGAPRGHLTKYTRI